MAGVNKEKQRLLKIRVGEVSVVGSPAIEEEFVIIKCLQEDEMSDKKKIEKKDDSSTEDKDVIEKLEVEVPDAVAEVMKKVTQLVDEVKKASDEKEEDKKEEEKSDSKSSDNSKDDDKEKKEDEEKEKKEEDVEKNKEEDILKTLESVVVKAKRFTPQREETLKVTIGALQNLLSEISPQVEEVKEEAVEKKNSNETLSKVVKAVTEMADIFKDVQKKVSEIEKVRQPSTSVEGDNDTDKNKKVEKDENIWSGVL